MKKLSLIKGGLELLVSIGVGAITGSAIKMVKPQNIGAIKKIAVGIGGLALANMVADKTVDYVDQQWEDTAKKIKEFFTKKKEDLKDYETRVTDSIGKD